MCTNDHAQEKKEVDNSGAPMTTLVTSALGSVSRGHEHKTPLRCFKVKAPASGEHGTAF